MTGTDVPHIAVLIAAHNRRALTVRALQALRRNHMGLNLSVVLFDDGSGDGTAAAVRSEWPDAVVLQGNGSAFWNGGMHQAWLRAQVLYPDGFLWLNDDVRLDDDALPSLMSEWRRRGGGANPFILVGATREEDGRLSYGGQRRVFSPFAFKLEKLPISNRPQPADTFNGNIVLISRATVEKIGINDPSFFHSLGDIDYGLRAKRAGVEITVVPGTLGVCNTNPPLALTGRTLVERWRMLTSYRGIPLANWYKFTRRFSGIWFPFHFALPYRKVFVRQRHRKA